MKNKETNKIIFKIKWDKKTKKIPLLLKYFQGKINKIGRENVQNYLYLEASIIQYIDQVHQNDNFLLLNCDVKSTSAILSEFKKVVYFDSKSFKESFCLDILYLEIILNYMNGDAIKFYTEAEKIFKEKTDFKTLPLYTCSLMGQMFLYYAGMAIKKFENTRVEIAQTALEIFEYLLAKEEERISNKKRVNPLVKQNLLKYLSYSIKLYAFICISELESSPEMLNVISKLLTKYLKKFSTNDISTKPTYIQLLQIMNHIFISFWERFTYDLIEMMWFCNKELTTEIVKGLKDSEKRFNMISLPKMNLIFRNFLVIIDHLSHLSTKDKTLMVSALNRQMNYYTCQTILICLNYESSTCVSDLLISSLRCAYNNPYLFYIYGLMFFFDKKFYLAKRCLINAKEFTIKHEESLLFYLKLQINYLYEIESSLELINKNLYGSTPLSYTTKILLLMASAVCQILLSRDKSLVSKRKQYLKQALKSIEQAIEMDPNHGEIIFLQSYINALTGETDKAIELVKKSSNMIPDDPRPHQLLVLLLTCQKKYVEADKIVEKAVRIFNNNINLVKLKIILNNYINGTLPVENSDEKLNTSHLMVLNLFKKAKQHFVSNIFKENESEIIPIQNNTVSKNLTDPKSIKRECKEGLVSSLEISKSFNSIVSPRYSISNSECNLLLHNWNYQCLLEIEEKMQLFFAENLLETNASEAEQFKEDLESNKEKGINIIYISEYYNFKRLGKNYVPSKIFLIGFHLNPNNVKCINLYLSYLLQQYPTENDEKKQKYILGSAESLARRLIQLDPDDYKNYTSLGIILNKMKCYEESALNLKKAKEMEVNQPILPFDTIPIMFSITDD